MKKWLNVSLSLVVGSSLVAGCSQSDVNGKSKIAGAQDKSKTITVNYWGLSDHDGYNKPIIADFEKENPDIKIKLTTRGSFEYYQSLKVAASSGTLPDIWFNQAYQNKGFYYADNLLSLDLTAYANEQNWDQKYTAASLQLIKKNNQITGVPVRNLATGLYYNKSVFQKLNLPVPKTFDELEANLAKIRAAGILPFSSGGKGGRVTQRFMDYLLEHYVGSATHDKLFKTEAAWNDANVIKAYEKMKEWADKEYFAKGFLLSAPTENAPLFYQGKAAMTLDGSWFDGQNILADKQDMNNFGVFRFPTDQNPLRLNSFVEMLQLNAKLPQDARAAALKFAEYVSSKEVMTKHAQALGGPLSAIGAVAADTTPHVKEFADFIKEGTYMFELPDEIDVVFTQSLEKVILGQFTPKQAAEFMEDNVKQFKARSK